MCEAVDTFRQALAEQGLDAEITHESNDVNTTFYVSKQIFGKTVTYASSYQNQYSSQPEEKKIALCAERVAQKIENHLTEMFDWGGGNVTIELYDGPEAVCRRCGTSVGLPPRTMNFAKSAEMSAPEPMPIERGSVIDSFDEHDQIVAKMYLIGKLQRACGPCCENSVASDDFLMNE